MFALYYFMETCFLSSDNIVSISNIIIKAAHHHFKLDLKSKYILFYVIENTERRKGKRKKNANNQKEHIWLYQIHLKTSLLFRIEKSFDNFKNWNAMGIIIKMFIKYHSILTS